MITVKKAVFVGVEWQHRTLVSTLASGPSCPGFHFQHYQEKFPAKKFTMLLRLIDGQALRKVDSGLKMLIQPF